MSAHRAPVEVGAGAYANHSKYRFRIYLGTEDQEPGRLIRHHVEAQHGADATPAFRGLVYIVFEDLPLDEFGNRIPGITAEIAWAGAPQAVVKDTTFPSATGYFTSSAVLDPERGFLWFKTSPDGIGRIRTSGTVEDLRVAAAEPGIDLTGVKAIASRGTSTSRTASPSSRSARSTAARSRSSPARAFRARSSSRPSAPSR